MNKPRTHPAFTLFFPLAALLAGVAVPLSMLAMLSGTGWPAGLSGSGHGFELIFGFALALIAGYTLGPQPARVLYPLIALWLAARLLRIPFPDHPLALPLAAAFALLLAWRVVPRFRAARQWRNKSTGPLILTLCLLPVGWLLLMGVWQWRPELAAAIDLNVTRLMHAGVLCLLLLMSFIGGRLIAPAAALTLEQQGIEPRARLQPRLEGALIIALGTAILVLLAPIMPDGYSYPLAGGALLAAGAVLLVRNLRWQLWRCGSRPDLLGFGMGYLWLALGSLATGLAFVSQQPATSALHLITVGGLGTLSTSVMLRLYFQRRFKTPPPVGWVLWTVGLIAVAVVCRFMAGDAPLARPVLLSLSAGSWSVAYLCLAVLLVRLGRKL